MSGWSIELSRGVGPPVPPPQKPAQKGLVNYYHRSMGCTKGPTPAQGAPQPELMIAAFEFKNSVALGVAMPGFSFYLCYCYSAESSVSLH